MKKKLSSSNVKSASYDKNSKTLTVTFKKGDRAYDYKVPKSYYNRITASASPGKFVHKNLKNLPSTRVK